MCSWQGYSLTSARRPGHWFLLLLLSLSVQQFPGSFWGSTPLSFPSSLGVGGRSSATLLPGSKGSHRKGFSGAYHLLSPSPTQPPTACPQNWVPFSPLSPSPPLLQTAQRKIREIGQQVKQQEQKYPQGVASQRSK